MKHLLSHKIILSFLILLLWFGTSLPVSAQSPSTTNLAGVLSGLQSLLTDLHNFVASLSFNVQTPTKSSQLGALSASLSTNLVGYWNFDEGSGTTANDSSGNGNTGRFINIANPPTTTSGWTTGVKGGALSFDGVNDYVDAGSDKLNTAQPFTMSAWVNSRVFSLGDCAIAGEWNGGKGAMLYCGGNRWDFHVQNTSILATTLVSANTWVHLVGTYDGITARLYLNGVQENSATVTATNAVTPFNIGTYANDAGSNFPGSIDEVRVYNRALSPSEVSGLYADDGGTPAPTPAPTPTPTPTPSPSPTPTPAPNPAPSPTPTPPSPFTNIDSLQPGQWYEAPNSHLRAVAAPRFNDGFDNNDIRGMLLAWNSGAYDTKRDRLVLLGGGHADYGGNEVYTFDVNLQKWIRLNNPSSYIGWTDGDSIMPDGTPMTVHTYDGVEYLPSVDKLIMQGEHGWKQAYHAAYGWLFDFDTKKWTQINNESGGIAGAYDPVTGNYYDHRPTGSWAVLREYNPVTNVRRSSTLTGPMDWPEIVIAAIDPIHRYYVAIRQDLQSLDAYKNKVALFNLNTFMTQAGTLQLTTGDTGIMAQNGPGFVWDPAINKFVAWAGGTDVYTLDPSTWVWTKVSPSSGNTVIPSTVASGGYVFGHFQYIPSKNIFIAVNSIDENVYFYKLPGSVSSAPTPPAPPPPADTTAPIISNPNSSGVTSSTATLSWSTNESADTQVEYGLTTSYGNSSPLNASLGTSHSVSLSGLSSNTLYHYRVKSKDAAGNVAKSGDFTFTTPAIVVVPPPVVPPPVVILPPPPFSASDIPLTIKEPVGVARTNDPITSGIPLPPGTPTTGWSLFDGGTELPLQTTALQGRTPWMLLDFQASIAAGGTKTLTLKRQAPTAKAPAIDTSLRATNIKVVDSFTGQTWTGVTDREVTEYQGPVRTTIRVDGHYTSPSGTPIPGFTYSTRYTYYAGKRAVKIEQILKNSLQTNERHLKLTSATLLIGSGGGAAGRVSDVFTAAIVSGPGTVELLPVQQTYMLKVDPATGLYANNSSGNSIPVSVAANGGYVLYDLTHYHATVVYDPTNEMGAQKVEYPLFALANASLYSDYGEMSRTHFGTLEDEKNTYRKWGWTWTANKEPSIPLAAPHTVSLPSMDTHGTSEADDSWENNMMFIRTGLYGYFARAREWAQYFKYEYPFRTDNFSYAWDSSYEQLHPYHRPLIASAFTLEDKAYLGQSRTGKVDVSWDGAHVYGWGMLDWYLLTGDSDVLQAATDVGESVERLHEIRTNSSGFAEVRVVARKLMFAERLWEITGDQRWKTLTDNIMQLILGCTCWSEEWGVYGGATPSGNRRIVPPGFMTTVLNDAMYRYDQLFPNTEVRRRLIKMADFVKNYGLHPKWGMASYYMTLDDPSPGQINYAEWTDQTEPTINNGHTYGLVDILVRGYRLTGNQEYLNAAKVFWERGSKGQYGQLASFRNAGPNQVGHFADYLPDGYSAYFPLNGEYLYVDLLFYDAARDNSPSVVTPPASPAISITAPAADSTVSGLVTLSADVASTINADGVQFFWDFYPVLKDGTFAGYRREEDTNAPYSIGPVNTKVSSSIFNSGSHLIQAQLRDTSGNYYGTSIAVRVDNSNASSDTTKPTVSLSAPAANTTVSGTVTLSATASDNVAVAGVQFKVDNSNLGVEDNTAPYSASWDSKIVSNGSHTITAIARDAAGNTNPTSVTVTVNNIGATPTPSPTPSPSPTPISPTPNPTPSPTPTPVVPSTGSLLIKRVGSDDTVNTAPSTQVKIDGGSLVATNPATFSLQTDPEGDSHNSHTISVSNIPGYTLTVDGCVYSGSTVCTVSSFKLTPVCSGGLCSVPASITANQTLKVVFKYIVSSQTPPPTPPPTPTPPSPQPSPTPVPPSTPPVTPPTPTPQPTPPSLPPFTSSKFYLYNPQVSLATTTAKVIWYTTIPASSIVEVRDANNIVVTTVSRSERVYIHELLIPNLTPDRTYTFHIHSLDSTNTSRDFVSDSLHTSSLPNPVNKLPTISTPETTKTTSQVVGVTFDAPKDTSSVQKYEIRYISNTTLSTTNWNTATLLPTNALPRTDGQKEQITIPGLSCGTPYSLGIRTKDSQGNLSDLATTLSLQTKTCPPKPPAPTIKFGSITLTWDPQDYPDGTLTYRVIRSAMVPTSMTDPNSFLIGTTTGTTITDTGVQPNTTYTYAIASYSDEGEFSEMTLITVTTPASMTNPNPTPSPSPSPTPSPTPEPTPSPTPPSSGGGGSSGGGFSGGGSSSGGGDFSSPTPITLPTPTPTPSPMVITPTFTKSLYLGTKDQEVTNLQRLLIQKQYLPSGNDTGFFGPLTQNALKKFQCDQGIVCSGTPNETGYGVVGRMTRERLNQIPSTSSGQAGISTPSLTESQKQTLITQLKEQIKQLQVQLLQLRIKLLQEMIGGTQR